MDQFMFTDDFKRLIVGFVMGDTLMTLRLATKAWKLVVDAFIDKGVRSGTMIVHGGNDMDYNYSLEEKRNLVTRVIFHLDITNVGQRACFYAVNLVVVDIPDGIKSIGRWAFSNCKSLTTVSLPRTLTSIGHQAFAGCFSLENVDLLHTNLQVLEGSAFWGCSELKSMTIPDSLQTLVAFVFHDCSKLVPSNTIVNDDDNDTTSKVVAHLRSKMQREEAERIAQENNDARARRLQQRQARREKTK